MTRQSLRAAWVLIGVALGAVACSDTPNPTAAFCEEVSALVEIDLRSFDTSAADDPAVRAGLRQTADQVGRVAAAAPEDIRPAVDVIEGLINGYVTAVAESDSRDPFERAAAVLAVQQEFSDDLPQAVDAYTAYVAQHCTPAPPG